MKKFLFTIFISLSSIVFSQTITGKVQFDDAYFNDDYLGNITILNNKTNKKYKTSTDGQFVIEANVGDEITLTSPYIIKRTVKIRNQALKPNFIIYIEPDLIRLNEVRVNNLNKYLNQNIYDDQASINTLYSNLGLDPNVRFLEPTKDVSKFKATDILNVGRLYGHFSGKNKEERKMREIESKIKSLEQVENLFPKEFYTEKLNIPDYKIKEFILWVNSKQDLTKMLNNSPREMIQETLFKYSTQYKRLLKDTKS